jgi:mannose-6-phosphate isomerase
VIIEVQSGEYLGEDDIVRFQDDYNRCPDKGTRAEELITE